MAYKPFSAFNKKKNGYRRSRSETRVQNNLGIIALPGDNKSLLYRDKRLEWLDSYFENRQYDNLSDWDQDCYPSGEHIHIRKRKPRIRVPLAKTLCSRLVSMMIGGQAFPDFRIDDAPDEQEFIKIAVKAANLKYKLIEPFKRLLAAGSVFIRVYMSEGKINLEQYLSKYCYPVFDENGDLASLTIKYVYEDKEETDKDGNFKKKWFKMDLTTMSEILYNNPDYDPEDREEPEFSIVEQFDHNLGFVQGTWFKTAEDKHNYDGYSLIEDVTDYIDELCYSLSQSSKAVQYNQDPQLIFNEMDEEEMATFIRSVEKSWNLGRSGKAEFLESNLTGVEKAIELRDKMRQDVQDIVRVLLLDPEKIVGNAQSAKAMEVMHGPMVDLVREIRGILEPQIQEFVTKILVIIILGAKMGVQPPFEMPPGWSPTTLGFTIKWNPIFPETVEDQQKRVSLAVSAKSAGLLSRETALKNIADIFGIEDIELETKMIDDDPVMNPFGGF